MTRCQVRNDSVMVLLWDGCHLLRALPQLYENDNKLNSLLWFVRFFKKRSPIADETLTKLAKRVSEPNETMYLVSTLVNFMEKILNLTIALKKRNEKDLVVILTM